MTDQSSRSPANRLSHLDNLRVFLIILVILHHTSIAYGGGGDWGVKDPAVDEISPIFLTFFTAVNQTYFMSMFFLLAGYFTPRSLERKGAGQFLKDRLIRLGIPILVYTTLLLNVNVYMIQTFVHKVPFTPVFDYNPGHLWFLQALLLFAILYMVYRLLADRLSTQKWFQIYPDRFPPGAALVLSIVVLTILTFAVRLGFPVGVWTLNFQLGHFVHYIFSFFVGILAYRGDWFNRLSKSQARRWGVVALVVIPLFFLLAVLGGVLEDDANVTMFLGGPSWQAFALATWDSILFIAISVFLLYFFRERVNRAGPVLRAMADKVYTVYIIHQTLLFALNILFLPVNIPTILKFPIVALIAVPLCFSLSALIRKIPYTRRVLG